MAFELEAFLYLRKLIIRKKLHSCLNGALYKVTKKCTIVYNDYTKEVIKFKDIQFIEAESKGTIVRNANNTYCIKNSKALLLWSLQYFMQIILIALRTL